MSTLLFKRKSWSDFDKVFNLFGDNANVVFSWLGSEYALVTGTNYSGSRYIYVDDYDNESGIFSITSFGDTGGETDFDLDDVKRAFPFSDWENGDRLAIFLDIIYAVSLRGDFFLNKGGNPRTDSFQTFIDRVNTEHNDGLAMALRKHHDECSVVTKELYNNHLILSLSMNHNHSILTTNNSYAINREYYFHNTGYVYQNGQWQRPRRGSERVIHSYSTRAPNLLSFKGENKQKIKDVGDKFKSYYSNYFNNTKVSSKYDPTSPLYLGIELEYEVDSDYDREDMLDPILDKLDGHVIVKSDGSLENGLELVSCPATYDEHVKAYKPFFDDFPDGLFVDDTCGLHIHVSRLPLSVVTQSRMIAFMNNASNYSKITQVAGRTLNSYCKQDTSRKVDFILRNGGTSGDRYNVLNTNNQATLEFRIFSSTSDFNKLLRAMQFCVAVVEYCKPCSSGVDIKSFKEFSNFELWLKDKRKAYPQLCDLFLGERKVSPKFTQKSL